MYEQLPRRLRTGGPSVGRQDRIHGRRRRAVRVAVHDSRLHESMPTDMSHSHGNGPAAPAFCKGDAAPGSASA